MSGLEVAAFVLGGIPVLIEAIDAHKAGKSRVRVFVLYGSILNTLIRELQEQHVSFQYRLLFLFQSAGVIDKARPSLHPQDLIDIQRHGADDELRAFLGHGYGTFMNIVRSYQTCAKSVAARLCEPSESFLPQGKTCEEILQALKLPDGSYKFKQRFEMTMSRGQVQTVIDDLRSYNLKLKHLCDDIKRLEVPGDAKPSWRATQTVSALSNVRGYAQRFLEVASRK